MRTQPPVDFAMAITERYFREKRGGMMPQTVDIYAIGVWFCVGFFTGAGWAMAQNLVGKLLR